MYLAYFKERTVFVSLKPLLSPVALLCACLILAILNWKHRTRALKILVFTLLLLLFLSLPVTVRLFIHPLLKFKLLSDRQIKYEPQTAIVVLGGGSTKGLNEFGEKEEVDLDTLVRLRYAAFLAKKTGLPVLASGNTDFLQFEAKTQAMSRVLLRDFGVPVTWEENQSKNTWENARNSLIILKKHHIEKIYLVNESLHMKRALDVFQNPEIEVIPAPTHFIQLQHPLYPVRDWIPSSFAFFVSSSAFYEYQGLLWYKLRYCHAPRETIS